VSNINIKRKSLTVEQALTAYAWRAVEGIPGPERDVFDADRTNVIEMAVLRYIRPSVVVVVRADGERTMLTGHRLLTIFLDFFDGRFTLQDCSLLPDLEGQDINSLSGVERSALQHSAFDVYEIHLQKKQEGQVRTTKEEQEFIDKFLRITALNSSCRKPSPVITERERDEFFARIVHEDETQYPTDEDKRQLLWRIGGAPYWEKGYVSKLRGVWEEMQRSGSVSFDPATCPVCAALDTADNYWSRIHVIESETH